MRDLAPVLAALAFVLVPIIVILTRHQQKMTMLMRHSDQSQGNLPPLMNPEFYALQNDVHELKSLVSSLALSVDNLQNEVRNNNRLQERVKIDQ